MKFILVLFFFYSLSAYAESTLDAEEYCEHLVNCNVESTVARCVADLPNYSAAAEVNDPGCELLVSSLISHYNCKQTLPCDVLTDGSGCAPSANVLIDLFTDGYGACFQGRPPINPPDGWSCPEIFYNGGEGDGCDCGCGALDLDCVVDGTQSGCADAGCFADACTYCYIEGDDVECVDPSIPDPPVVNPPAAAPPAAQPESNGCANVGSGTSNGFFMTLFLLISLSFFSSRFQTRRVPQ